MSVQIWIKTMIWYLSSILLPRSSAVSCRSLITKKTPGCKTVTWVNRVFNKSPVVVRVRWPDTENLVVRTATAVSPPLSSVSVSTEAGMWLNGLICHHTVLSPPQPAFSFYSPVAPFLLHPALLLLTTPSHSDFSHFFLLLSDENRLHYAPAPCPRAGWLGWNQFQWWH